MLLWPVNRERPLERHHWEANRRPGEEEAGNALRGSELTFQQVDKHHVKVSGDILPRIFGFEQRAVIECCFFNPLWTSGVFMLSDLREGLNGQDRLNRGLSNDLTHPRQAALFDFDV